MNYYLSTLAPPPTSNEPNLFLDITNDVQKGVAYLTETAFDLNRVTTPSDANIVVNNVDNKYSKDVVFNREYTEYILTISENNIILFVGIVFDVQQSQKQATIKTTSVIRQIVDMNVPYNNGNINFTGTPADFVKYILQFQAILPSLFIDSDNLDAMSQIEQAAGIEIVVDIPATDKVQLSDLLQQLYKITGLYVFSENGLLRVARLSNFAGINQDNYDYIWVRNQTISSKTKLSRPIEWQKTRVVVPFNDGLVARNMFDYFPEGESILAQFKEKTIESDGIGFKLQHTTLASAIECMQQILGWRGFPRYQLDINISTVERDNKAKIQAVPLYSVSKIEFENGCMLGILFNKQITETDGKLSFLSIRDPSTFGEILFPYVKNVNGKVFIYASIATVIEYSLGDVTGTVNTSDLNKNITILNPSLKSFNYRIRQNGFCQSSFSDWFSIDSEIQSFIIGANKIGQKI